MASTPPLKVGASSMLFKRMDLGGRIRSSHLVREHKCPKCGMLTGVVVLPACGDSDAEYVLPMSPSLLNGLCCPCGRDCWGTYDTNASYWTDISINNTDRSWDWIMSVSRGDLFVCC